MLTHARTAAPRVIQLTFRPRPTGLSSFAVNKSARSDRSIDNFNRYRYRVIPYERASSVTPSVIIKRQNPRLAIFVARRSSMANGDRVLRHVAAISSR